MTWAEFVAGKAVEVGVSDSIWYGIIVLFGQQDRDWEYVETDPEWWTLRLWTRRN